MKVIGFCGLPGSGKSTVLKAIEDLGVILTMGDVIRNEARERGIEPIDENLGKVANELREEFGQEIIAKKCVELIKNLKKNIVFIDGLRSLAEVKVFRNSWKFPIVAVIIDDTTRIERLLNRGRPDDPKTLEEQAERDKREIAFGLNDVIDSANYKMDNNVTKAEVRDKTRKLIIELIKNY
ncbi:MAG: AAA family ATPase [Promethearchaeota archaeon]|jgi:dephospho-CoA kinase